MTDTFVLDFEWKMEQAARKPVLDVCPHTKVILNSSMRLMNGDVVEYSYEYCAECGYSFPENDGVIPY
jgi:hypothetical protein